MRCPVCNIDLMISDRQGIEIDYCPQCRGIWLDRGELDKVIERSSAFLPQHYRGEPRESHAQSAPHASHEKHGRHNVHRKHKQKSFLGELFDFD